MALSKETASFILEEASKLTGQHLCILNTSGNVIASLRPEEIGMHIEEAISVAKTGTTVLLDPSSPPYWAGVALPVYNLSSIIGVCIIMGAKKIDQTTVNLLEYSLESLIEKASSVNASIYKRRIIESWIVNLLDPDYSDWGELESTAQEIGIDTHSPSRIIVVHVSSNRPGRQTSISADASFIENYILQNIMSIIHVNFYCYLGRNLYALSIGASPMRTFSQNHVRNEMMNAFDILSNKFEQINMSCNIGIGAVRDSLRGYRESFQEANRCVNLAMRFHQPRATSIQDWHLLNFIYQLPKPVIYSFLKQYFANGEELKDELVETIDVYFKNSCAVQKTADDLSIHKNTLLYRFRRIKEVVGLDPQNFQDSVVLELWLRIRELYPESVALPANNPQNDY